MKTFREFVQFREGMMVADQKAEEGKSKKSQQPPKGYIVPNCSAAGGPGPCPKVSVNAGAKI